MDNDANKRAMQTIKNFLGVFEKKLGEETYLCGIELTLADILVGSVLLLPFRTVIDVKM
jgi:glutathione S-transferase